MALPFPLAATSPKIFEASAPLATNAAASTPELGAASHDPRALRILAKTIYRELRQGGLHEQDVMSLAGELLSLVAGEVKDRRRPLDEG